MYLNLVTFSLDQVKNLSITYNITHPKLKVLACLNYYFLHVKLITLSFVLFSNVDIFPQQ